MTQKRVEAAFENVAFDVRLHPCVWNETFGGLGYWECHRKAMSKDEACKWIEKELPWTTGSKKQFKFMTPREAWNPLNWTIVPFNEYVWTSK